MTDRTPEQIAAERYPEGPVYVPDPMFEGRTLMKWKTPVEERAAFIAGYREHERAAGVERAAIIEECIAALEYRFGDSSWSSNCRYVIDEAIEAIRALAAPADAGKGG